MPGIGPRRRKALLTAFGSVAGVRRAAREELARVVGVKAADAVLAHFALREPDRRAPPRRSRDKRLINQEICLSLDAS